MSPFQQVAHEFSHILAPALLADSKEEAYTLLIAQVEFLHQSCFWGVNLRPFVDDWSSYVREVFDEIFTATGVYFALNIGLLMMLAREPQNNTRLAFVERNFRLGFMK
jgi:hypothetical protein